MKHLRRSPFPRWLARASAGLAAAHATGPLLATPRALDENFFSTQPDARGRFGFAYDRVLGTSLDAELDADTARDAHECERQMLAEIDRLEKILSSRDSTSELSRVRHGAPLESRELAEVLAAYDTWSFRTGGALSSNLGEVLALWRDAARTGRPPTSDELAAAFAHPSALNVDALGKGYIIDRAVAVARNFSSAGLLNIGGDIRAWGDAPWMIGVANPFAAADNAVPLTQIPLRDAAIATSGGYARNFSVGGARYSHVIDARTLQPVATSRAASVVAADCVTANALSTALCALDAADGARLARTFALDHVIVESAGNARATGGFADLSSPAPARLAADAPAALENGWPKGFQVSVTVSLKSPDGFRAKRPYVAVWVEDSEHKVVRTLTVWGTGKYQPDLTKWWRAIGGNRFSISNVTRATRYPGAYTVAWDGRDQRGQPVPRGDYTVFVEINREHGHHVWESATLACGGDAVAAELRETAESDLGPVEYGPGGR